MPETLLATSLDPSTEPFDQDAADRRWIAWRQRGFARDARTYRRMGALAVILALALLGRFGWTALGTS